MTNRGLPEILGNFAGDWMMGMPNKTKEAPLHFNFGETIIFFSINVPHAVLGTYLHLKKYSLLKGHILFKSYLLFIWNSNLIYLHLLNLATLDWQERTKNQWAVHYYCYWIDSLFRTGNHVSQCICYGPQGMLGRAVWKIQGSCWGLCEIYIQLYEFIVSRYPSKEYLRLQWASITTYLKC